MSKCRVCKVDGSHTAGCVVAVTEAEAAEKKAAWDAGWMQGLAYSVGVLARWGEESHAGVLLQESGCGYNEFDGVDEYDRKVVRCIFRTDPGLREAYKVRRRAPRSSPSGGERQ